MSNSKVAITSSMKRRMRREQAILNKARAGELPSSEVGSFARKVLLKHNLPIPVGTLSSRDVVGQYQAVLLSCFVHSSSCVACR